MEKKNQVRLEFSCEVPAQSGLVHILNSTSICFSFGDGSDKLWLVVDESLFWDEDPPFPFPVAVINCVDGIAAAVVVVRFKEVTELEEVVPLDVSAEIEDCCIARHVFLSRKSAKYGKLTFELLKPFYFFLTSAIFRF